MIKYTYIESTRTNALFKTN